MLKKITDLFNNKEIQYITIIGCFLSDATVFTWLYWKATSYEEFGKLVESTIDSPNFQVQLYKVLLQSLTFFLLLFISAQFIVYILAAKKFRSALLYLKLYSVAGFAVSFFIIATQSFYALCPALFYLAGYYYFAKTFTEVTAAQMQSSPQ